MKILGTTRNTVCMYCNSTAYGTGCPYSSSKKHVHTDDPKRCIYCGSTSLGTGCPHNSTGKVHVRGAEFNTMIREGTNNMLTSSLLKMYLKSDITQTPAFKAGVVDEDGYKIKTPETPVERTSFGVLEAYLFKVRRMMGRGSLELLEATDLLESAMHNSQLTSDVDSFKKQLELKKQVEFLAEEYKKMIIYAYENNIHCNEIHDMMSNAIDEQAS